MQDRSVPAHENVWHAAKHPPDPENLARLESAGVFEGTSVCGLALTREIRATQGKETRWHNDKEESAGKTWQLSILIVFSIRQISF